MTIAPNKGARSYQLEPAPVQAVRRQVVGAGREPVVAGCLAQRFEVAGDPATHTGTLGHASGNAG